METDHVKKSKATTPKEEPKQAETAPAAACCCECDDEPVFNREDRAKLTVNKYMLGAMAAGVIPSAVIDIAAITALQLKMLHSLAGLYETPYKANLGKSVVASLIGGLGANNIARGAIGSMIKAIPVVGPLAGAIAMPVMAGATTYAVGKVFIMHFEAGGTLLNFDPEKMREHFKANFEAGKDMAKSMKAAN